MHTLLRESRIFPGVELCDESPDYTAAGFADIWKGRYYGEQVCVKAIRTQSPICLMEIEKVCGPSILPGTYSKQPPYKIFRRVSDGSKHNPHPNVLPVIEVSETLFPFYIMIPWMPDGNITQYIQANPGVNRLILARAHQPEDR